MPDGTTVTANFELGGQEFMAIQAGPQFKFTEAVSFFVSCESKAEVDRYWDLLTSGGGEESMCGWLKDKFGLSWQIVPTEFMEMMGDSDQEKVQRTTQAMFQMKKLDVPTLRRAFNGE